MGEAAGLGVPLAVPRRTGLVVGRLRKLRERLDGDPVLAAEVDPFLVGDWQEEDGEVVCHLGERWCRLSASEITIGHDRWPGSKRVPL